MKRNPIRMAGATLLIVLLVPIMGGATEATISESTASSTLVKVTTGAGEVKVGTDDAQASIGATRRAFARFLSAKALDQSLTSAERTAESGERAVDTVGEDGVGLGDTLEAGTIGATLTTEVADHAVAEVAGSVADLSIFGGLVSVAAANTKLEALANGDAASVSRTITLGEVHAFPLGAFLAALNVSPLDLTCGSLSDVGSLVGVDVSGCEISLQTIESLVTQSLAELRAARDEVLAARAAALDALEAAQDQLTALQAQLDALEATLASLEATRSDLQQQRSALVAQRSTLAETLAGLQATRAALVAQRNSLASQLGVGGLVGPIADQIAALDAQIAAVDAQIAGVTSSIDTVDAQIDATDAQITETENDIADTEARIAAVRAQITATNEEIDDLNAELDRITNDLTVLDSVDPSETTCTSTAEALDHVATLVPSLASELRTLESQLDVACDGLAALITSLLNTPILNFDGIEIRIDVTARANDPVVAVTGTIGSIAIGNLPPIVVELPANEDELPIARSLVTDTLAQVAQAVGIGLPIPQIEILATDDAVGQRNGVWFAEGSVTLLRVTFPATTVTTPSESPLGVLAGSSPSLVAPSGSGAAPATFAGMFGAPLAQVAGPSATTPETTFSLATFDAEGAYMPTSTTNNNNGNGTDDGGNDGGTNGTNDGGNNGGTNGGTNGTNDGGNNGTGTDDDDDLSSSSGGPRNVLRASTSGGGNRRLPKTGVSGFGLLLPLMLLGAAEAVRRLAKDS